MKLDMAFICHAAACSYGDFDEVSAHDFLGMFCAGGPL